jgi:hypothetical protein
MGTRFEPELDASGLPRHWLDADPPPEPERGGRRKLRLESGRDAAESLMRVMGDPLLKLMLRRSFRPVDDLAVVPVVPCPHCLDGGLRLAGTVRERDGRQPVRGCDTCGAVVVGERRVDPGDIAARKRGS